MISIVIILLAAVLTIPLYMDKAIKGAIELIGSEVLGTTVTLGDINVSLLNGEVRLRACK